MLPAVSMCLSLHSGSAREGARERANERETERASDQTTDARTPTVASSPSPSSSVAASAARRPDSSAEGGRADGRAGRLAGKESEWKKGRKGEGRRQKCTCAAGCAVRASERANLRSSRTFRPSFLPFPRRRLSTWISRRATIPTRAAGRTATSQSLADGLRSAQAGGSDGHTQDAPIELHGPAPTYILPTYQDRRRRRRRRTDRPTRWSSAPQHGWAFSPKCTHI